MSSKLLGGRNRQKSPRLRSARAFATEVGGDEAIRHNARNRPIDHMNSVARVDSDGALAAHRTVSAGAEYGPRERACRPRRREFQTAPRAAARLPRCWPGAPTWSSAHPGGDGL